MPTVSADNDINGPQTRQACRAGVSPDPRMEETCDQEKRNRRLRVLSFCIVGDLSHDVPPRRRPVSVVACDRVAIAPSLMQPCATECQKLGLAPGTPVPLRTG